MGWGMIIGGFLFWTAVIAGVVLLVRFAMRSYRGSKESPTDTLNRRYAEGQITKEQYDLMRKDIEESSRKKAG